MEKRNQVAPQGVAQDRLKAERVEEPMMATKVVEKMVSLPGWGLSPKGISLARNFSFPSEEDARAFSDYLIGLGIGQKMKMKVTVEGVRVGVQLKGKRGGIPPYLLDFAAILSQ